MRCELREASGEWRAQWEGLQEFIAFMLYAANSSLIRWGHVAEALRDSGFAARRDAATGGMRWRLGALLGGVPQTARGNFFDPQCLTQEGGQTQTVPKSRVHRPQSTVHRPLSTVHN